VQAVRERQGDRRRDCGDGDDDSKDGKRPGSPTRHPTIIGTFGLVYMTRPEDLGGLPVLPVDRVEAQCQQR
jgi:hypothetical protein